MSPFIIGIIGIVVLLILFAARMSVAYALAVVGLAGFTYLVSVKGSFNLIVTDIFSNFNSYDLSVIPLFVLMGFIAFYSGISERLYNTANKLVGHVRGGLAMATILACAAFGAVCGSASATAATMSTISIPEMKKRHYDAVLAGGTVAAGNILGPLIPPSMIFIIYGVLTGVSIGKLFVAGILPGIVLTILYCITIYILTSVNPALAPREARMELKEAILSIPGGTGEAIIIFALVIGGLMVGFFTPTEAGAAGAFAVLLVGLVGRRLKWNGIYTALADTTKTSAFIMLIVTAALVFGHFLVVSTVPQTLNNLIGKLPVPPFAIMIAMFIIYGILGMFIDGLAMIVLTIPIFYPLVIQLGYDPIWFGVIIVTVGGLGGITPPLGVAAYVVSGVSNIPLTTVFRGVWPFVGTVYAFLIILLVFPEIATFLPRFM